MADFRPPTKRYWTIVIGPLIPGASFLLEHAAEGENWLASIPFAWRFGVWTAFMVGMLWRDVNDKTSWLREDLRALRRCFLVEQVVPAYHATDQREWLALTVHVRFTRMLTNARLVVRGAANTNLRHAQDQFLLKDELYSHVDSHVDRDRTERLILATLPLKEHGPAPPGYPVLGRSLPRVG